MPTCLCTMPVSEALDYVLEGLVNIVNKAMCGGVGVCEEARHLMCDGDESLSERIRFVKQAVRDLETQRRKTWYPKEESGCYSKAQSRKR